MKTTKQAMDKMNVIPRLRLANQTTDDNGKRTGIVSTGPHRVTFVSDKLVDGSDPDTGATRQEIQFTVDENGVRKLWNVPLFDKKGQPNYLIERLADVKEGDEVILESKRRGPKNYTSVQRLGHATEVEADEADGDPSVLDSIVDLDAEVARHDARNGDASDNPPF